MVKGWKFNEVGCMYSTARRLGSFKKTRYVNEKVHHFGN